ncbi:MAG TPA: sigma-70 family RNA polymerase sigma factor, partial [Acidimicrobiia bacterium]|nr:sigma-70 family RNA polymerase sigma factor [Acidimicrobiia bacterium]
MALRVPLGAPGFGDDDESVEAPSVAFEELWAERDVLRSYCLRLVGDPALADDMVQEAFIEAYRQLERLEHRGSFLPWLATVAKRRGLN